ncbi:zinc finger protein 1035 isoform 2-T2 [Pholidichthys leucotaenia]
MAHGWNPYFHNPTSLSSDPRTLRTSESEQNLSQHIEHFSGHHGFTGSVASQETPVYNSNYNMNYCSNPSVTDSSLDCVYQGYCRETQWQANEEQIEKDYLQECRASNNPDFVSESFPSSFATEFQGLKQDCGVPSTSFLENYSDVSSCSDADANETRPPCKFMPSKSFPEPTVEVPQNHNSSEWYFPHTSNMTVLTESVCPNMAERNVNCEESLECQSAKQAVTTYTACDRSSTASYILTTEGQTVHDRSYLDACQGLKQKDNIERDPTQAISTSSFESSGDESNEYQEYSKEEQIPLDPPNSISALNQEQLDEKISRNEPDKLFCKENESFDHPYSPTDQEEKLNAGIQNISEVSEVKRKETGERDDENSGVHNSSIPSSTNCSDENAEMDSREMLLETEAPLAKDTTDQLLKSSVHASQPKSNEISVQDTICRNLAEQSDAIVPKLSESFLQQKTSSTNTSLCPLEDGTSSKEQKNEAICTGDGIVDVALEQKDHSIGIHVESKKLQESSNMEINDSLEKEMVEPVKEVPASPPDQNDGSQSAVSDSLSVTTNDSLQDKGFGGQGVTSDDLSIDTSWENKQQSGVHLESSLEPKSSNMGLDSCVERKVSQEAKKSPTSVPNRDSTCSDKNKQGVIPNPCHSKSCIHPQNINTDMSSYVKEELTNSPGKTSPSSSPEQACSHPSEVNDGDENKESVAYHSELPLRPEGSNTDIQPYLENEVTDRPQNKNSSSSLILDCSILSDTVSIDGGDENKQSTACHSDSPLPPENLSPDTHSSLEKERASPGEKLSQTFSPEQNCSDPHVGDSLSVDINDANKQNDANNLESSLQCDSSNTDMHPCLENQWTNESSSTDPEYTSHNVTTNSNNQNVLSSLETCLEPDTSNSCTSVSEKEWTRPIEKNATTFPDVQESLRESPVAEDLASLTGDFSENARESFEDMDSSIEEQPVPDILFGEPLSREDSLCDSDDMKPLSSQDGDDMDPSEREVLILKTSAQMRKRLQPIVILKSLESSNIESLSCCLLSSFSL